MPTRKFGEIYGYYEAEITSGRLTSGQRVPSVRAMATLWDVSPSLTARVIWALKEKGLVVTGNHPMGTTAV